ncbi:DUF4868 domain-containing protein [Fructilactobacillus ixorae]|uniref:DUF4868 domain-containing protein n=1 Tax=Fructilactobacillus ixorae TaxID=1750535 RepID=A0ABY5C6E2_9LACO|nr:Kiwa anti-phage protein KwaB-like domain-containing protein [Fructilactobacillus ixorae]USS93690.1 DUF4868 domain-containing protein [Fructilactobacillus ixorae]
MEDLKSKYNEVHEILNNGDIEFYLMHWTVSRKIESVSPTISKSIKSKFRQNILDSITKPFNELTVSDYNIIGSTDDTIEKVDISEYKKEIDDVLNSLKNPMPKYKFSNDNFDFFIYKVTNESGTFYAFSKSRSLKKIRQSIFGRLSNKTFTKIENMDDFICIDKNVDLILYNGKIYVLNHLQFERMFKISDEFQKIAKDFLDNQPKFKQKIKNFENFQDDVSKNKNVQKRIVKLSKRNSSTLFLDDLKSTSNISKKFNLGLQIDVKNGKINYTSDQLGNLINLMQDSYYKTLLGEEDGIDTRR